MKFFAAILVLTIPASCADPTGGGQRFVEEYESGQIRARGYIAGRNVRTGRWEYWHENGEKKAEGRYVDHEKVERWTYWDASGKELPCGPHTSFDHEGKKTAAGNYKEGQKDGAWTRWGSNGTKFQENYHEGKKWGQAIVWHENGQKLSEGSFYNNLPVGAWSYWHDNGQIARVCHYSYEDEGELAGTWREWHANGTPKAEGTYVSGSKHGLWTEWNDSHQIVSEGVFEFGKHVGVWNFYHKGWIKASEGEFKGGSPHTLGFRQEWDPWREGKWTFWDEGGSIDEKRSGMYRANRRIGDLPKE